MHKPGCLWCLMVLLCAAPQAAQGSAPQPQPQPTGATPEDAKIPVGSEFNPAGVNLNLPRPDERYTNNPALNNLIAPAETTAPSVREQEMKEIEEDFRKSADPEREKEMKKKAAEERRKVKQLLNPRKRGMLGAADEQTEAEAIAAKEAEEEAEEERRLLPSPAGGLGEEAQQRRPGSPYGAAKAGKALQYNPPAAQRAGRKGLGAPAAGAANVSTEPKPQPVKPVEIEVEKLFEELSNR